ncbi:UNKNOWN [Stylonychia lemnae]|uniref:Uncharacterized protein n=1 Tax=Stylonychia lemnae TaxID=5949 RepID=A0A078AVB3_STYLE|nr:UNKNOWN [Stylonychia lemnae]|eukprot:CDW86124.1 UNKNOWN [Stylonychia lemnae]
MKISINFKPYYHFKTESFDVNGKNQIVQFQLNQEYEDQGSLSTQFNSHHNYSPYDKLKHRSSASSANFQHTNSSDTKQKVELCFNKNKFQPIDLTNAVRIQDYQRGQDSRQTTQIQVKDPKLQNKSLSRPCIPIFQINNGLDMCLVLFKQLGENSEQSTK